MGALSSPSLSDWVLPFGADGSGGPPPVAIVLTPNVLTQGVSGLARWLRSLKAEQLTCEVWSHCCVCGTLQNGMNAQLDDN